MPRTAIRWLPRTVLLAVGLAAMPAVATVKDGVDAWSRGEFDRAIAEWQGPASAGDPDAMFNMGQAYRLGRGVPEDIGRAEAYYAAAAEAGHIPAADTLGLLLFQDGRREAALPLVRAAAERGDPRSQYLLGIAHFNGDLVEKDWVRAYALMTLASAQGLPQAPDAIAQMDLHIPLEDRQRAASLAREMGQETEAVLSRQLAAADLGAGATVSEESATPVSPSVAAARAAVEQAREAVGTSDPAQAGASFADSSTPTTPSAGSPASAPVVRESGPWLVQLGAFSVPGNAQRLWERLSAREELQGRDRLLVPAGRLTKLQAGGYPTRASAQAACRALKAAGQDCLVTRD